MEIWGYMLTGKGHYKIHILTVRKCSQCPVGGLRKRLVFTQMAEKIRGCPRQLRESTLLPGWTDGISSSLCL